MNTNILLQDLAEKAEKSLIEIFTLRKEMKELDEDYRKLAQELHDANNLLQRNIIEISTLKKNNLDIENESVTLKEEIVKFTAKINSLSEELKNKEEENILGKKNFEELKNVNTEIEARNADLVNENESGKNVILEYEHEIKRLNDLFEQKKKTVTKKKIK